MRVGELATWLVALSVFSLSGCVTTDTDPELPEPDLLADTLSPWTLTNYSVEFDGALWRGPLGLHVELFSMNVTRCHVESEYTLQSPAGPGPSFVQIGHAIETRQSYVTANGEATGMQAHALAVDTREKGVAQVARTFGNFTSEPFQGTFHLLVGVTNIVEDAVSGGAAIRVTCDAPISGVHFHARAGAIPFDDHSLKGDAGIRQSVAGQTSASIRDGIYLEEGRATFVFVNQAANGVLQLGDQSGTSFQPLAGVTPFILRDWKCPCSFDVSMVNVEAQHAFYGIVTYA